MMDSRYYKKEEEALGRPLTNYELAFLNLDKQALEPVVYVCTNGECRWVKQSELKKNKKQ